MDSTNHIAQTVELNLPNQEQFSSHSLKPRAKTASVYFAELFPEAARQFGCPFVEIRDKLSLGSIVTPVSINLDFFASALGGDARLGESTIYFEPEMQWYYKEPVQNLYKPTTPEKLQNQYRGWLMRAAQELPNENNRLNLCIEFRSDKTAKAVVQRAKSILAVSPDFFSATSPHTRIKGPELQERLMRVLCETMLEKSENSYLTVTQAYKYFCHLAQMRQVGQMKRSMFKATMTDLVREQFGVGLRRDVVDALGKQQEAWRGLKLVGTEVLA